MREYYQYSSFSSKLCMFKNGPSLPAPYSSYSLLLETKANLYRDSIASCVELKMVGFFGPSIYPDIESNDGSQIFLLLNIHERISRRIDSSRIGISLTFYNLFRGFYNYEPERKLSFIFNS